VTGIAAIDESGNTGPNGTRYFVISAVISNRSRNLLQTSKLIKNSKGESKFYNCNIDVRKSILEELASTDSIIVSVVVDKYDFTSKYYGYYKNELYEMCFKDLIDKISHASPVRDLKIYMDETSAISNQKVSDIIRNVSKVNILSCKKYNSFGNKCVQIADFVAGAIREYYADGTDELFTVIKKCIRCP